MGTRFPLTNVPIDFSHECDVSITGGRESFYIPGAVHVNNTIRLPPEFENNLPYTWFHGESLDDDSTVIVPKKSLYQRSLAVNQIRGLYMSNGK